MGTETEIKVKIDSPDGFCRRLNALDPIVLSPRHFEDNHLYDFEDGRLRSAGCLVRVRHAAGRAYLTYKGPPRAEGLFKIREELETTLKDGAVASRILEKLGLRLWFRYQKYRREFRVDDVVVAVDETPAGDFAEFEGSEERIQDVAGRMRIDPSQFIKSSYYTLYMEHCRQWGVTPGHMVF